VFLTRVIRFLEWKREFAPRRRVKATRAVNTLAVPGALPTPEHTGRHVDELIGCHERLNNIAHHGGATDSEMISEVERFETLLLTLLGGRSTQLRELDELMGLGDDDAD
jgi:hypothetical protein